MDHLDRRVREIWQLSRDEATLIPVQRDIRGLKIARKRLRHLFAGAMQATNATKTAVRARLGCLFISGFAVLVPLRWRGGCAPRSIILVDLLLLLRPSRYLHGGRRVRLFHIPGAGAGGNCGMEAEGGCVERGDV